MFAAAVRAIAFVRALPPREVERLIARQLLKSSTSVPAAYRAACRAQSSRDFIAKMKKLEEEADESVLWLAILRETGLPQSLEGECRSLTREFDEFTAIAVSSVATSRASAKRRALRLKAQKPE
jgi:four helix bundle protein